MGTFEVGLITFCIITISLWGKGKKPWFECEWLPKAYVFEFLDSREMQYLKGLGGVTLLKELCHLEWALTKTAFQAQSLTFPSACGSG